MQEGPGLQEAPQVLAQHAGLGRRLEVTLEDVTQLDCECAKGLPPAQGWLLCYSARPLTGRSTWGLKARDRGFENIMLAPVCRILENGKRKAE